MQGGWKVLTIYLFHENVHSNFKINYCILQNTLRQFLYGVSAFFVNFERIYSTPPLVYYQTLPEQIVHDFQHSELSSTQFFFILKNGGKSQGVILRSPIRHFTRPFLPVADYSYWQPNVSLIR